MPGSWRTVFNFKNFNFVPDCAKKNSIIIRRLRLYSSPHSITDLEGHQYLKGKANKHSMRTPQFSLQLTDPLLRHVKLSLYSVHDATKLEVLLDMPSKVFLDSLKPSFHAGYLATSVKNQPKSPMRIFSLNNSLPTCSAFILG